MIAGVIVVFLSIRRLYSDWRKDNEFNLALAEKEKTIQRIATEARGYKYCISNLLE